MLDLIKKFEDTPPEIIFEWKDRETEAEGWAVINSLRGGAAGGGTRMRKGLNKYEVISLAKTMEVKFTVSGPAIGGAKSGINFDPNDPRKTEVLKRWYQALTPVLKSYYGTGGDLNIDEIEEVIPITENYGLWHPQEGIVNGHYQPTESKKIQKIDRLRQGVSKKIFDLNLTPFPGQFTVADLITGYGVVESLIHYYHLWGGNINNKKILIQGWGNVGAAAGYFLTQAGAKITGIIDKEWTVSNTNGFSSEEIKELIQQSFEYDFFINGITTNKIEMQQVWNQPVDIFVPAAGSRLVNQDILKKLIKNGLQVISSGANVSFNDPEIFYGKTLAYADAHISVIPDFIANCGMARVFSYLMEDESVVEESAIFTDVSKTIYNALNKVYQVSKSRTEISKTALEIALKKLVNENVYVECVRD